MSDVVMEQARKAKAAARKLGTLGTATKNAALLAMAEALIAQAGLIKDANAVDVTVGRERGLSEALLDRLALNDKRIQAMADGLRQIAARPDPVGQVLSGERRPNGLELQRVRVPLGARRILVAKQHDSALKAGRGERVTFSTRIGFFAQAGDWPMLR